MRCASSCFVQMHFDRTKAQQSDPITSIGLEGPQLQRSLNYKLEGSRQHCHCRNIAENECMRPQSENSLVDSIQPKFATPHQVDAMETPHRNHAKLLHSQPLQAIGATKLHSHQQHQTHTMHRRWNTDSQRKELIFIGIELA